MGIKIRTKILAAIVSLTLGSLNAAVIANDTPHLYGTQFETIATSSDFKRQTLEFSYGNNTSGKSGFGVSGVYHRIDDAEQHYQAREIKIRAGTELNPVFYLESSISAASVEATTHLQEESLIAYYLSGRLNFDDKNSIIVGRSKDFAYRDQILSNAAGDILTIQKTRGDIKLRPAERLRLEAATEHRQLSDGNRSQQYKAGAYYGISPGWPWIWAGIEASTNDYERQDEGYWTPENHRAVSATFSSSIPASENINFNTSASISRSRQDGSDELSTGYYFSVGSDIELSQNSQLSAGAHYIKSEQDASEWSQKGATIGLKFNHY